MNEERRRENVVEWMDEERKERMEERKKWKEGSEREKERN